MPIAGRHWSFSPTVVSGAPDAPGVFALYESGELIYLGSTVAGGTLRSALAAHLRRAGAEGSMLRDVTHYAWEIVGLPDLRELELLDEFQAQHGKAPRCNEAMREASLPAADVAVRRRRL